jgi:hypothetical protein
VTECLADKLWTIQIESLIRQAEAIRDFPAGPERTAEEQEEFDKRYYG